MRALSLTISSLFTALIVACAAPAVDATAERTEALRACGLAQDTSIAADADVHACAASDTHKTTICHIPPGNPANAHTLCVGSASVSAHEQHGDTRGACASETPCAPPDGGDGSGGDGDGSGGDGGGSGSGDGGVIL